MAALLHFSGGQGSSDLHKENRGVATLTFTPLLEGRWESDHDHTPPLHKRIRTETMATFPNSFWKREAIGHSHTFPTHIQGLAKTPPLPRKRETKTIASFHPLSTLSGLSLVEDCLGLFGSCLEFFWKLSGNCSEFAWRLSGYGLETVWKLSGVWRVLFWSYPYFQAE